MGRVRVGIIVMLLLIRWGSIARVLLVEQAVLRGRVSWRVIISGNYIKLEEGANLVMFHKMALLMNSIGWSCLEKKIKVRVKWRWPRVWDKAGSSPSIFPTKLPLVLPLFSFKRRIRPSVKLHLPTTTPSQRDIDTKSSPSPRLMGATVRSPLSVTDDPTAWSYSDAVSAWFASSKSQRTVSHSHTRFELLSNPFIPFSNRTSFWVSIVFSIVLRVSRYNILRDSEFYSSSIADSEDLQAKILPEAIRIQMMTNSHYSNSSKLACPLECRTITIQMSHIVIKYAHPCPILVRFGGPKYFS